jgi:hypothetical protein
MQTRNHSFAILGKELLSVFQGPGTMQDPGGTVKATPTASFPRGDSQAGIQAKLITTVRASAWWRFSSTVTELGGHEARQGLEAKRQ